MYILAEMIGVVKTNTQLFCKETIEKITKGLTGRFLPPAEEQVYGDEGQFDNCYWLQV